MRRTLQPAVSLFLLVVVAACGSTGGTSTEQDRSPTTGTPPTASGPHSEVVAKVEVGGQPCGVVGAAGSVWVSDAEQARLLRIDPTTSTVVDTIAVDETPCEMTFAHGSIWLVTQSGFLDRIDPATGRVVARIRVGQTSYEAVSAFGSVWVTNRSDRTISRVDPRTNTVAQTVEVPDVQPGGIVAVGNELWVGNDTSGETHLIRLDPDTGKATRVEAGGRPAFVAATEGAVWTANQNNGTVTRIDAATGEETATLDGGDNPVNLDVLPERDEVWVPADRGNTVVRIDAASSTVLETVDVGLGPAVVAAVDGDVWVTNFGDGTVWRIAPAEKAS